MVQLTSALSVFVCTSWRTGLRYSLFVCGRLAATMVLRCPGSQWCSGERGARSRAREVLVPGSVQTVQKTVWSSRTEVRGATRSSEWRVLPFELQSDLQLAGAGSSVVSIFAQCLSGLIKITSASAFQTDVPSLTGASREHENS